MKKIITIVTCFLLIGIGSQASAYFDSEAGLYHDPQSGFTFETKTLAEVGNKIDPLIDFAKAGNIKTELSFINETLPTNYTQDFYSSLKIEFKDSNPEDYTKFFYWVDDGDDDNANIWAFELLGEPDNFTIKTGGKDKYLWIYDNTEVANWGVIQEGSLPTLQLASLTISETMSPERIALNNGDITSISHMTVGTSVPEPEMMLLFGTGIVGLAGVAMRRKKK